MAKGFTQMYGIDYMNTFSPIFIRVIFSLALNLDWSIYHMDIKNAFLCSDLVKDVYIEQSLGYVA